MTHHTASKQLQSFIFSADGSPAAVAALLDGLDPGDRLEAVRSLGPRAQARLFKLVNGAARVTLDDLVPPDTAPLTPVRHYGKNSLLAFTLFEKRFYRTGHDKVEVAGANFQRISPFTGPGYFVAREDAARGEALIDYHRVPAQTPDGWPAVRDNDRGVSRLIYGFMIDTLRRVSEHVTIGAAARHGKPLGAYFVLCREARA